MCANVNLIITLTMYVNNLAIKSNSMWQCNSDYSPYPICYNLNITITVTIRGINNATLIIALILYAIICLQL